ncbi:hypothetical protein Tco_0522966 [Tanacetum coccineum]
MRKVKLDTYSRGDVLNYAFLASRLWYASLQTMLLRYSGAPLFSIARPCSTCYKVFMGDIYEDHDVSCAEVDTVLDGGHDKPLHPADMLLYLWDRGLDVCVDLTGSSSLTQTRYWVWFSPFSFSSFGELEKDAVALLKRIRKFYVGQDIRTRAAIHISNRISFAITKGVVEFKNLLAQLSFVLANEQSLHYRGMILKDDQTLDTYDLQADHTIHLVIDAMDMLEVRPPGGMPDMSLLYQAISFPSPYYGPANFTSDDAANDVFTTASTRA